MSPPISAFRRDGLAALLLAAVLLPGGAILRADSRVMPSAPAGISETGAPYFVVMGPEALGLSTAPNDMHLLPDGRVLVVSQQELAFGDGVRWETFRGAENQQPIFASVAVDRDGRIYTSTSGAIARIDLTEDARWHFTPVMTVPGDAINPHPTLVSVATFPDQWCWYGSVDTIISWRPGQSLRIAGKIGAVDRVFELGPDIFLSKQSGELFRLAPDGAVEKIQTADVLVSETVTCATPFGSDQLLVGTGSAGLKLFDGKKFRPFGAAGPLNSGHRITDLSPAGEGLFAAAVEAVGIVFFDRTGHIVQVLERSLDHRLARVRRLIYASNGVLWALLNEGVARVEFPSPVSHFEPLLASGLAYPTPVRHAGRLWILADGKAMRGVYDAGGQLERFEEDTPPGRYLFTLSDVDGQLFACNDAGIYLYEGAGWRLILPGIINARLGVANSGPEGMYYVARGEYGVIQRTGQDYAARRIKVAGLGENYNSEQDSAGITWLELGGSRVGRLDPNGGKPTLQILGSANGLGAGWVELFLFDGVARFHLGSDLYRFDVARQKFVQDRELLARYPQLASAGGRPTTDQFGRCWYTANGVPEVIDRSATGGDRRIEIPAIGFSASSYMVEENGVVWMTDRRRLVRLDLRFPQPPPDQVRALITSVQLPASNRQIFSPTALAPLDYADNSLVVHFAAPANPFAAPLTFEVLLEGAGTQWISTGAVGAATYNRLKEGDYVFRVRPVAGRGNRPGTEARLPFTVRPPWYRTPLAWAIYFIAIVGLFAFVTWLTSYLQRRENDRLERLVAMRTRELNLTNAQLGRQIEETTEKSSALSISEERYRLLNTALDQRVQERTAELSRSHEELQQRELLFRLIFEHAPVGISWKRADLGPNYHFNSTFQRILDLPAPALPDYNLIAGMLHPEDAPRQAGLHNLIESDRANEYTVEQRYVRNDGGIVWGLLSVAVIRDAQGRVIQEIGILEDITARKKAERELAETYKSLVDVSRTAGMAEVATGVLHNVGNVLNSLNVSATVIATGLRQSKADSLVKLSALLHEHRADLAGFLTQDPKGKRVLEFLESLARHSLEERGRLLAETASLQQNVDHIKEIVSMQQAYSTMVGIAEALEPAALMEDSLRMNAGSLVRHEVTITRQYQPVPFVLAEKAKVLQILINLIRNAQHACEEGPVANKVITLIIEPGEPGQVRLIVRDTGVGIPPANLTRIFAHGFTTKATGHGFGLHSAANAAKEMKGSLTARSDGPGTGATFILELPAAAEKIAPAA